MDNLVNTMRRLKGQAGWLRALRRAPYLQFFKSTARGKENTWRANPWRIYPPLLRAVLDTLEACDRRGHHYYVTNGFRSYETQAERYHAYKSGTGYRAAPPGRSAHQWGAALDFVPDRDLDTPGIQADWEARAYDVLVEESERRGLKAGRDFGDNPHIQIPTYVSGRSMAPLREIWRAAKAEGLDEFASLQRVWDRLYSDKILKEF